MLPRYNDKPQDLVADTKLVFTNCMLYTQVSSPHYYHMAEKMLGIVTEAYANAANGNGARLHVVAARRWSSPPQYLANV